MRANAVAMALANAGPPKVWSIGTVTAVNAPTVNVAWQSDNFTMHYLDSYTPHVGDIVLILTGGQQLVVLGSISS